MKTCSNDFKYFFGSDNVIAEEDHSNTEVTRNERGLSDLVLKTRTAMDQYPTSLDGLNTDVIRRDVVLRPLLRTYYFYLAIFVASVAAGDKQLSFELLWRSTMHS